MCLMLYMVLDALEDVLDGIFLWVFARFDGKPLVTHVLKGDDFLSYLILGELLPGDGLVLSVVRAVDAAVDTVVGEIQRSEHDDPVAVEVFLDLLAQIEYLPDDPGILALQKGGRLLVGEPLYLRPLSRICLIRSRSSLCSFAKARVSFIFSSFINSSAFLDVLLYLTIFSPAF